MAGVRSSKTVDGTQYKFTTLSGLVTRQEWDGKAIDFVYDENNQPLAMKYGGAVYYYVLNLQGDVVGLVDGSRNFVARYTYDPWGKPLTATGTLANVNPLRYRGYYYDSESGFYYLQSRYYDPALGRLISSDSYATTDANGLLSANMFAYCENDPVNMYDPDGHWAVAIAGSSYFITASAFGATNVWNPIGWVVLGAVSTVAVIVAGEAVIHHVKSASESNNSDPYARPGQKKQGRERKSKARKSKDWKQRSNPKPPKKHTPGRTHRKYK